MSKALSGSQDEAANILCNYVQAAGATRSPSLRLGVKLLLLGCIRRIRQPQRGKLNYVIHPGRR
jgi:hypothetical protein